MQRACRGWTSAGSGFGKLHWDFSYLHVYISQVRGPKDFMIFSPDDTASPFPRSDSSRFPTASGDRSSQACL